MSNGRKQPLHETIRKNKFAEFNKIKAAVAMTNSNATLSHTSNGDVLIRLHNADNHPTTYSVTFRTNDAGEVDGYRAETLANELKDNHVSLEGTIGHNTFRGAVVVIQSLLDQPCDGTPENTAENYVPMGLLFMPRLIAV